MGSCSISGDGEDSAAPSPEGGQGEDYSFIRTHIVKERAISLSSEFSGSRAESVRCTASSLLPAIYLASGQQSAVGGRRASPRTSSQSLRGLRSSARMSQNAGPSVPSSSTPLRCTTTGTPIVSSIITQARAPSTRQAYALKWSLFANWCSSRREDPRRCTIGVVLSFLQERL